MKFCIFSDCGNSMGAALKIQSEGNEVEFWCKSDGASSVGKNMLRDHKWKFTPDYDTTFIFDATGMGLFAESLRIAGYAVCCGGLMPDRFEMDRAFSHEMLKRAGLQAPPSKFFTDWKSGMEYVRTSKRRLVLKPCEHLAGNLPSHVAHKDYPVEEMLGMMDHYERTFAGNPEYELQDFWPGTDVSTEIWWDGEKILYPLNHTLETKPVMDGDRGATAGCAGNVIWPCDDLISKLIEPVGKVLAELGYPACPLDVNGLWNGREYRELETSSRWGYDASPTLFYQGISMDLGKLFADLARGQLKEFPIEPGYAGGVRVTIPPYPDDSVKAPAGLPILGVSDKDLLTNLYPYDVMKTDEGKPVTAGSFGMIGVACGYGATSREAMEAAIERAKSIVVDGAQFRLDLADVFDHDLAELGLLKGRPPEPKIDAEEAKPKGIFRRTRAA